MRGACPLACRSIGIGGAQLAELIRHTPAILRCGCRGAAAAAGRRRCRELCYQLASVAAQHNMHALDSRSVAFCPCSASVDEQLEPLAALIQQAGGSPAAVLLTYPGIAAVPVAHLKGTRHVLRQLDVTGAHSAVRLPAPALPACACSARLPCLIRGLHSALTRLALRRRCCSPPSSLAVGPAVCCSPPARPLLQMRTSL